MSAQIIRGNALAIPLAAESVDLIVTSPPYFGLRSYQDGGEHYAGQIGSEATPAEFVDALIAATREMVRVLKPPGSIWVNLGDKYAEKAGPARAGGIDGGAVRHRAARPARRGLAQVGIRPKSLMGLPWRYALRCIDELGLILRAEVIWAKPTAPTRPAVVLDPFGGTGTTALVADVLGRHGISVDMSRDYCRLAEWRTTDPGERARAMQVEKPPAVLPGQLDLFSEDATS